MYAVSIIFLPSFKNYIEQNSLKADNIQQVQPMKKIFPVIICVLILSPTAIARRDMPLANENKPGLYSKSIEHVLRLRRDDVDLATAALIVSENWSDMVHGRRYLSALDDMALEIRERLRRGKLKLNFRAIPVINDYLFNELGYKSISEASDPNSLFLHTVMDKKRGYCLSLSVLYLSIAERLGLPLYGVVVPGHFFVRYDDGRVRFNIETTSNGGNASDEHYINKFKVPEGGRNGIYMKNLNKIQTLGCFFNNLGNSYSDIGNVESALLAFERAVEINPALSESRANLGNIYLKKDQIAEAIYQYQEALEINPNDAKTHNNLGNAYTQRDSLGYAVSEYLRAIKLDPNFVDAYKNLAIVYGKQERYGRAISQLRIAIAMDPEDAGCCSQLGDVYNQQNDCEQAITQYKKALKIDPDLVEAHYGLALCYNKLGLVDDEIWEYKRILAIRPDMLSALVNLGNAYFGQDKYSVAIEQYEKAIRIKPDEAMVHYNLGAAYSKSEDYEQAVAAYLTAVEIDPGIGDAHYGLAFGFYQLKKYDLAWKHIKMAQELGVEVTQEQLNAIKSRLR
jgi:tetratricopeptide (TPR) repeat protein